MALGDFQRINTNIAALNALSALKSIGAQLGVTQLRLASGKRINEAADDPAGLAISGKLDQRARGLATALDSVGTFSNVLGTAEGGAQKVNDILLNIRSLVLQAASSTLGTDERNAIKTQTNDLSAEIDRLRGQITFNGLKLLDGTFTGQRVQTGSDGTDSLLVSITQDFSSTALGLGAAGASIAVDTVSNASSTLALVDSAVTSVRTAVQGMGSVQSRLRVVQDGISVGITNTLAAKARITDADVAAEQVNAVRLQILQQLATAELSQANTSPQQVLALFR